MSKPHIHIGELILQKLKKEKLSVAWLAVKVDVDPSNLHKRLKKMSMDIELLWRISKALNFPFYKHYFDFGNETNGQ